MNIQKFKFLILALSLGVMHEAAATQYVRYNVNTAQGQANLKAMEVAFWKMQQMGCDDPRSWYYQGAIHQVPQNLKKNPSCPDFVVKDSKPPVLKTAWSNCTHAAASSPQRAASDLNFLLWHRLYTAHLEAVVRQLSGKADFTIPYFDYENIQTFNLPLLLRSINIPAQRVSMSEAISIPAHLSALYTPSRRQNLNAGKAIDPIEAATIKKAVNALDNNSLFISFSNAMNQSPHGEMHDYLGGDGQGIENPILQTTGKDSSGLMANVSSAGFDPVFWLHHAAIDRLWAKWDLKNKNNPYARPSLQTLQQQQWPYVFFNANGKQTNYTNTQQVYRTVFNPDYRYDDMPVQLLEQDKNQTDNTQNIARPLLKSVLLEKMLSNPLSSKVQTIAINTDNKNTDLKLNHQLLQSIKSAPVKAWTLDLELKINGNPTNNYQVFLVQGKQRHFVGIINFFGIEHQAHNTLDSQHHHDSTAPQLITDEKNFEIGKFFQSDKPFNLEISPIDGTSDQDAVTISKIRVSAYQAQ